MVTAPKRLRAFDWQRWPETEAFVDRLIEPASEGNASPRELAERMIRRDRHAVQVWVDHLVVGGLVRTLAELGRWASSGRSIVMQRACSVFAHAGGIFPRIALSRPRRGPRRRAPGCRTSASWRSRSSRSRRSREPTTWGWRSSAIRWGPTGSARSRASERPWLVVERRATWDSSRSPASWPARAG